MTLQKNTILIVLAACGVVSSPVWASTSESLGSTLLSQLSNIPSNISSFFSGATTSSTANPATTRGNQSKDYTRYAIANNIDVSKDPTSIKNRADQTCVDIKASSKNASTAYVQRRVAPSPVNTIRDNSCFVDVLSIKIPQTGYGFVDQLVGQLSKFASNSMCNSTTNSWGKIVNSAASGDVKGLMGGAISSGTNYVAQNFDTLVPTAYGKTPAPYTPATKAPVQATIPTVAPVGGPTIAGYAMCGNAALITENIDSIYPQFPGSQSTSYTQGMMSRGVGYSLSFTTGPDVSQYYDGNINPLISAISANITNSAVGNVSQRMVISSKNCDFNGDQGVSTTTSNPLLKYIVTANSSISAGVPKLLPNTTYYLNYIDSDGSNFTCPTGMSCDFNINFSTGSVN